MLEDLRIEVADASAGRARLGRRPALEAPDPALVRGRGAGRLRTRVLHGSKRFPELVAGHLRSSRHEPNPRRVGAFEAPQGTGLAR